MNHENTLWFLGANFTFHKPNNILPYKWSHCSGMVLGVTWQGQELDSMILMGPF